MKARVSYMKKNNFMRIFALILVLALVLVPTLSALADAGWGTDYGGSSGGDFDFDFDFGGSDGGDFIFIGGDGMSVGGIVVFIIVVILIIVSRSKAAKNRGNAGSHYQPVNNFADIGDSVEATIRERDPEFVKDQFLSNVEKLYVKIQYAWTERDSDKMRPFESDALFNKHKTQLEEMLRDKKINVMERICVNQSYICGYRTTPEFEYVEVYLNAQFVDYIIDEDTRKVLNGSPDRLIHSTYKLTMVRGANVLTNQSDTLTTVTCPNCKANIDITATGKCEYCETVVTTSEHCWVLDDIDYISQR
ncbi:MAG: Tim44 domain-containing protein [Clostridiales bacterium]|nr:Tim44 domain-containing protein [Clostridiales bacterium]